MPVTNYYTVDGAIVGEQTSAGRINYATDALGSVTGTLVGNQLVNTYAYKPYGALLASTGSGTAPKQQWVGNLGYRPTGRAQSDYYVRARHYGPAPGRWTTVDPLWPQESAYNYLEGAPACFADTLGLSGDGSGSLPPWLGGKQRRSPVTGDTKRDPTLFNSYYDLCKKAGCNWYSHDTQTSHIPGRLVGPNSFKKVVNCNCPDRFGTRFFACGQFLDDMTSAFNDALQKQQGLLNDMELVGGVGASVSLGVLLAFMGEVWGGVAGSSAGAALCLNAKAPAQRRLDFFKKLLRAFQDCQKSGTFPVWDENTGGWRTLKDDKCACVEVIGSTKDPAGATVKCCDGYGSYDSSRDS